VFQIAHESGVPLSQALEGFAENSCGGRHTQWAKTLAQRLSDGISLRDAVKINGMDPLLASLLSSPSGRSLGGFVSGYIKHLLLLSQWDEKLKTTMLYPVILIWMVVMNLFLINIIVFPVFAAEHALNGTAPSLFMKILFFADGGSWPFSLIVPGMIIWLAIDATYSVFFLQPERLPFSLFGRMMGSQKLQNWRKRAGFSPRWLCFLKVASLSIKRSVC
jgi:type II secretory pathway component PulF